MFNFGDNQLTEAMEEVKKEVYSSKLDAKTNNFTPRDVAPVDQVSPLIPINKVEEGKNYSSESRVKQDKNNLKDGNKSKSTKERRSEVDSESIATANFRQIPGANNANEESKFKGM